MPFKPFGYLGRAGIAACCLNGQQVSFGARVPTRVFLLPKEDLDRVAQARLAEAGFHVVSFLSDVPTGLFADRWLVIQALTTAATLVLAPTSFVLGFLSVSLGALAWSFTDFADRALLFGIVAEDGDASAFGRAYGMTLAVNLAVRALATAMGGWMVARAGWYMPYGVAVIAALLGIFVVRALPESRPVCDEDTRCFGRMAEDLRSAPRNVQKLSDLTFWVLLGASTTCTRNLLW